MRMVMIMLLLVLSATVCGAEDYLYTPQKVTETRAAGEGVLVREVTVKRGETLSHLAKRYAGRGHYYPQILLFNAIKNPHRIRSGQLLRVPLYAAQTMQSDSTEAKPGVGVTAVSQTESESVGTIPPVVQPAKTDSASSRKGKPKSGARGERRAYQQALSVYRQGNCERAVKEFDRFISRYPASVFVAEATLNRAECYLKMSDK